MILDSIDMTVHMMAHALTAPGGGLRPWALRLGSWVLSVSVGGCSYIDPLSSGLCHP